MRNAFILCLILSRFSTRRECLTVRSTLFKAVFEVDFLRKLTNCPGKEVFGIFGILIDDLIVSTCAPLVDRAIGYNTTRVNHAARDCFDDNSCELIRLVDFSSVEELNLLERSAGFFGSVSECIGRPITARKQSVEISPEQSVDCSTLDLLNFFLLLKHV